MKKSKIWKKNSLNSKTVFDVKKKREKISVLWQEVQKPDFWQNQERAIKINQELTELKKEIGDFEELEVELELLKEKSEEKMVTDFERKIKQKEFQIFLSGEYDKGNAILSIYSGAGGQDAQDWTTMLLRMYERYCAFKGFKTKILHQSFGEAGGPEGRIGIKSVTMEVRGNFVYGLLKKEGGVHRLVRISPFSSKSLRHTSFALVETLPIIEKKEVEIKPEDLKIEFYRASGPGGQYVNKRETSVRITHLPTGLAVACQSERLQGENRKQAMELLTSKLYLLKEEEKNKEISRIKGKPVSIEWGNQIRSYILQPYKLVKDLRTGIESPNPEEILDGNLDNFIEAEIKLDLDDKISKRN